MAIPEIDQIKRSEEEAAALIEAARHRRMLAIEEAKREGEGLVLMRLSDAEKRLREERERAESQVAREHARLMDEVHHEAGQIRAYAERQKNTAVSTLIRLITGE
ncbi:hypothetical protein Mhun_1776 [Methanospirillum hungatei JF-1]|uniref:Uncharacterized protein n=1 Tax=Methanospirillum hungatei JF-1 (strain ATCC 27890 / DSM 864 / NBRC 100397 / JF-1) TaxID=323259 RepID=Q2FM51_METHJ|nr:hypothetical protein [Methanospirillum hungatei]ABD41497.1 hypothetical protein Mhun_1776 [Methanospirillum hungatei JF-1]